MANKLYTIPETAKTFQDTGGTEPITLNNLAAGAGRVSDQLDLLATAHSPLYSVTLVVQFATAPVIDETVDLYMAVAQHGHNTEVPGGIGVVDAALGSTDELKNLRYVISLVVTSTTASHEMRVTADSVEILGRYVSFIVHNDTADNLLATNNTSFIVLAPTPLELQ